MKKELIALREAMKKHSVDVFVVPTNDFHGSEYINDYFKTRRFVSCFTGSAGTLVVTADDAELWTDGRYFLQAGRQLEGSGIGLMKAGEPGVPKITEYISGKLKELPRGSVLGFDGRVMSYEQAREYEETASAEGAEVVYDLDLVGEVWKDRPALSGNRIWQLPAESCGKTYDEKIERVRGAMAGRAEYHLITGLEENAWLYNLRGSDVAMTPVFFSFTLITPDDVRLYVFDDVLEPALVPAGVTVRNYFDLSRDLAALQGPANLLADLGSVSYSLIKSVPGDVKIVEGLSPATCFKAVKNPVEIASTKKAHVGDGVAMVKFIHWLKTHVGREEMTEISVADHLRELRAAQKGFIDLSFDTIAGYMDDGAIIHYSATPETNKALAPEGFLLVDSGGQYLSGTTDITRTIALGPLTDKMKKYYTAVLRGHIDLTLAEFEKGTSGKPLDLIARAPLAELGLDYNHGTGHGVGHVLSVHEGPQTISRRDTGYPMEAGMITSDEPGVYIENEFGVRIENENLCVEKDGKLGFEPITLCPYEPEAIVTEMLTDDELSYLNGYHRRVYEVLAPHLTEEEKEWLRRETEPLKKLK